MQHTMIHLGICNSKGYISFQSLNFDLHDVISWFDISDVDPLTVDVMPVQIPAPYCDALLSKISTFITFGNTCNINTKKHV